MQPTQFLTEEHVLPLIKKSTTAEVDNTSAINSPSASEVDKFTTFPELEAIFKSEYPDLDLDHEEEEDKKDEEKARTALNIILQEFGKSI